MIFTKVRVKDAYNEDIGKGIIRVDSDLENELNVGNGDIIKISNPENGRITAAKIKIGLLSDIGTRTIRIDSSQRRNLAVSIGDIVEICKTDTKIAAEVVFVCPQTSLRVKEPKRLTKQLEHRIITKGDIFSFKSKNRIYDLIVTDFTPKSEVFTISKNTSFTIKEFIPEKSDGMELYSLYKGLRSEVTGLRSRINALEKEIGFLKLCK